MTENKSEPEKLFQDIGEIVQEDNDDVKPTEIESYCMNCGKNGITKLLLTKIPYWRDIVIMSFDCECGFNNNEVQFAGAISEKGCEYTCEIHDKDDLNRQLVKSETASIKLPEIDLEIPATTKRGRLTTVEGVISSIIEDLSAGQSDRKLIDEDTYNKIEIIINKLNDYLENKEKFSISVDDPSGNSYIENLLAPNPDPKLHTRYYNRTREMDIALGLMVPDETYNEACDETRKDDKDDKDDIPEVMTFPANCSHCNAPSDTKMHLVNIPHFKEVVIMSTVCDVSIQLIWRINSCGYKSNEVKSGGPISPNGKKITLKMEDIEDLSRDILKSETCSLLIPEIELELRSGTLGGRFTTVEGLFRQVYEELKEKVPFVSGDSAQNERKASFEKFLAKLNRVITGEDLPVHLVLDDPLTNSYLQNPYAPDPDPNMQIEIYERSWEQNEFLGLNDVVLENYEKN
ncbi:8083_t:CDS:2 [Dentiscutata erythropus]|uniref:8083_t:CDS:1 n=1 Tax=Dentiscutata erythropus TaxID=1348616 RepID=A0A9N9A7F5_9GLOM|nr:8083_t:CDS:2 [Dentiscutata erythropus]